RNGVPAAANLPRPLARWRPGGELAASTGVGHHALDRRARTVVVGRSSAGRPGRLMVRLLRIYFAMQAAHLRAQLQYEADVWLALIGVALGQIVGALFISSLFRLRPALGGWSIWEAAVPYGLIGLARGLSELLCEGLWHIRTIVARGELDVPLVRPLPLVFQIATRASDLHSLSNLIIGSSIIGLAFHRLGLVLSAAKIIFFVFTMAGSTLVMAAMILIANSIAFWDRSVDSSLP